MATLQFTASEAARDFSSILARVREGDEVYIGDENGCVAMLVQPDYTPPGMDPAYDAEMIAAIDEALADPRPPIDGEVVEAYFAKRKQENRLKAMGIAG